MPETKYLIVGGSHAGLAALDAIRLVDPDGPITLVTKEDRLPYSPTVLPYVFSGLADPERVFLRSPEFFQTRGVKFMPGTAVKELDAGASKVRLDDGGEISFQKALFATGARPLVPPIEGLATAPYCLLRTLDDALALKKGVEGAGSAIVLGAGLVGMHAAENLAQAGVKVTLVEMLSQVLPGYFDRKAGSIIKKVFTDNGVKMFLGSPVTHVLANSNGCALSLESGLDLSADLLLVATGVRPNQEVLSGEEGEGEPGVLVDDYMRTEHPNVWAAGDLVRARCFFRGKPVYSATLPLAVEQGRIAGADMAGDPGLKPYQGSISANTYSFFGNRAFSVGWSVPSGSSKGLEVDFQYSPRGLRYQKLVFKGDHLVGAMGVNCDLDPGVMWQLIRGKVDLAGIKKQFAADPRNMGRLLMSKLWR